MYEKSVKGSALTVLTCIHLYLDIFACTCYQVTA